MPHLPNTHTTRHEEMTLPKQLHSLATVKRKICPLTNVLSNSLAKLIHQLHQTSNSGASHDVHYRSVSDFASVLYFPACPHVQLEPSMPEHNQCNTEYSLLKAFSRSHVMVPVSRSQSNTGPMPTHLHVDDVSINWLLVQENQNGKGHGKAIFPAKQYFRSMVGFCLGKLATTALLVQIDQTCMWSHPWFPLTAHAVARHT
eukprot:scpid78263/ scgid11675/ 